MYTLDVPFKDYNGTARTAKVQFNLDAREVFKILPQLQSVFTWLESNKDANPRELTTAEVSSFYTDFEAILLDAWGEISEDGLYFRKTGKYDFEESALFNACMVLFVTKPELTARLLEGILPPELAEMAKNADKDTIEAAVKSQVDEKQAEINRLKRELAEKSSTQ